MIQIFAAIAAVAEAFPVIDGWLQRFALFYAMRKLESMKQADREALQTALTKFDQRPLEQQLGNSNAGQFDPSVPDTVIVDSIPGVPKSSN